MFDLTKDLERYAGIPPYASELYGVYQPLLGWRSALTRDWIRGGGELIDPRIKRILDGRIAPGPDHLDPDHQRAEPLQAGRGRRPWTVVLVKDLGSRLMHLVRSRVQTFVDAHDGRLPAGRDEWLEVLRIDDLVGENTLIGQVNDYHRQRLWDRLPIEQFKEQFLTVMQYESQVAALLIFHIEEQEGYDSAQLAKLFAVRTAAPLDDIFRSTDPLATIDPNDHGGTLSPVGFMHLFRQYFFNLGTFLGEPTEHVWLAPGTTTELIEVSTRRTLVERSLEEAMEKTSRTERSESLSDELSDATKEQNQNSVRLGVSQSNTANVYVYQGNLTTTFGLESTRTASREQTHKQVREQSEKLSSELKQSFKSVFRTVTETTDTKSRRYLISNPGSELVNYELRRKMRRVGVQLQDIGTRLCWQVYVDNAGDGLGVGELVHLTELGDLTNMKEPEKLPRPAPITKRVVVPLAYKPVLDYSNNKAQYEFQGPAPNGVLLGIIKGDEDDDDSQIVMEFRGFKFDPPQTGYALTPDVRMVGVQGGKLAVPREITVNQAAGSFDVVMQRISFGGENVVNLEMELVFAPTGPEIQRVEDANKALKERYDEERRIALRRAYVENVRARIKDAAAINPRPGWDLRDEERTVIYRKLLERLMLGSWTQSTDAVQRRVAHVRSELVRALFDVDAMLYFVAPEWWMPRRHRSQLDVGVNLGVPQSGPPVTLTEDDVVQWGGANANRPDNYKITEDSVPAKLGSSLGWLLQLDGDNLRNAFLNAPWVKAVIPIRSGRETAALNWLHALESHEDDGWDATYVAAGPDDAEFQGKTVGEVLEIVADRLERNNEGIGQTLAADKVFEHGFSALQGGFDAGLAPNEVFSQWISVVPTDQIVATTYEPTELLTPPA